MISTPNQHRILKRISCAVLVLFFWIALIPFATAHASALDQAPTALILENDSYDAQNGALENFQIAQSPEASLENSAPCLMARIQIVSDQKSNECLVELQITIGNRTLAYFRARYYHAQLGRFISRDPKGTIDGMSLYRAYFVPGATDPSGLWTWEIGASGEIWAISEGNTLQDLENLGYQFPGKASDDWIPKGCRINVTEFVADSVATSVKFQQEVVITPENLSKYLFNQFSWDPGTGIDFLGELVDDAGLDGNRWKKLATQVLRNGKTPTVGEVDFYKDVNLRINFDLKGQCYDFAALGLGICSTDIGVGGPDPWDWALRPEDMPNGTAAFFLDGRNKTGLPKLNDLAAIHDKVNKGGLKHVGIVLGSDNDGSPYAISRTGGRSSIKIQKISGNQWGSYSGNVEYYRSE